MSSVSLSRQASPAATTELFKTWVADNIGNVTPVYRADPKAFYDAADLIKLLDPTVLADHLKDVAADGHPIAAGVYLYMVVFGTKSTLDARIQAINVHVDDADILANALRYALPAMARIVMRDPQDWTLLASAVILHDPGHRDVGSFFVALRSVEGWNTEQYQMASNLVAATGEFSSKYNLSLPFRPEPAPTQQRSVGVESSASSAHTVTAVISALDLKVRDAAHDALTKEVEAAVNAGNYDTKMWAQFHLRVVKLANAKQTRDLDKSKAVGLQATTFGDSPGGKALASLFKEACEREVVALPAFEEKVRETVFQSQLVKLASQAQDGNAKGLNTLVELSRRPDAQVAGTLRAVLAKTIAGGTTTKGISVSTFNELLAARMQVEIAFEATKTRDREALLVHADFIAPLFAMSDAHRATERPYFASCDLLVASGAVPASKSRPASGGRKAQTD